jgi:hypothetical protein
MQTLWPTSVWKMMMEMWSARHSGHERLRPQPELHHYRGWGSVSISELEVRVPLNQRSKRFFNVLPVDRDTTSR